MKGGLVLVIGMGARAARESPAWAAAQLITKLNHPIFFADTPSGVSFSLRRKRKKREYKQRQQKVRLNGLKTRKRDNGKKAKPLYREGIKHASTYILVVEQLMLSSHRIIDYKISSCYYWIS